jgi:hypothetical protein
MTLSHATYSRQVKLNLQDPDDLFVDGIHEYAGTIAPPVDLHEQKVHLVDAEAIRQALLGLPKALTALERGAALVVCDQWGLDREIVGLARESLDRAISRAREAAPERLGELLETAAVESVPPLVDAVRVRDAGLVEELLVDLDVLQLRALTVVLADMLAAAGAPRDPGADVAHLDPEDP